MILQNIVLPNIVCPEKDIYFRTDGNIQFEGDTILLDTESKISTDTYMNLFDLEYWKNYSNITEPTLYLAINGRFRLSVRLLDEKGDSTLFEKEYCFDDDVAFVRIPLENGGGQIYFSIDALYETRLLSASYITNDTPPDYVNISVIMCTYHRIDQLTQNLCRFQQSRFWIKSDALYGKLKIYVIDNGEDVWLNSEDEKIKLVSNSNQGGGSGGFERGLEEIRKDQDEFPCTHVVFMDDDVEFQSESFYRLYAFLTLLKAEYRKSPIAGRMFRMDRRYVQYTAAEIWNGGNILHLGGNCDMRNRENLFESFLSSSDYGGWWLCVYPSSYALQNQPFPFFLHCDDVEYGLRCMKHPLILRGFQVWHETYEFRLTPKIIYYDVRNAMVVNILEGMDVNVLLAVWKQRLDAYHNADDWAEKYFCALALWHFGHPQFFIKNKGKISNRYIWLSEKKYLSKITAAILHRVAEQYVRKNILVIRGQYQKLRINKSR